MTVVYKLIFAAHSIKITALELWARVALETKQSKNKEAQEQWISRIMEELEKGMNYWNPEIEITMKGM